MTTTTMTAIDRTCPRCQGYGFTMKRVIDCDLTSLVSCDHPTHHERVRCVLCRGSKRADVFTLVFRRAIDWLARTQR